VLDFARYRVLTFDCYGTLIDWERGILDALRPVCARHGASRSDDELLALFARTEAPIQQGPYRPYREVLREAMVRLGRHLGFELQSREAEALARSLPSWPPFPDTVPALRRLARRFALGVISNVDDDLFAGTSDRLGVRFEWVVTAQQVGSYKPARANFHRALERIGRPWDQVLHVAQSLFHDVAPARSLGLATVWVDRRAGRAGTGATPPSDPRPDLEVPDLATLAALATHG
jgi:2-haloacid dehalogenase